MRVRLRRCPPGPARGVARPLRAQRNNANPATVACEKAEDILSQGLPEAVRPRERTYSAGAADDDSVPVKTTEHPGPAVGKE